jgi:GNAT superfamily N-acetyltransferase
MNSKIEYLPINCDSFVENIEDYVSEAASMVADAYDREREFVPYLPDDDFSEYFHDAIKQLFPEGLGVAALHENRLVGFLAGIPVEKFHGMHPGVYCPVYGHATVEENRIEIYRGLYQQAARLWIEKGLGTHAITMFLDDQDLVDSFFCQGFGMRCIDAIRKTAAIDVHMSSIEIRKSTSEEAEKLSAINTLHTLYYRQSPMFMIKKDIAELNDSNAWLSEKNNHEWAAYRNDVPVGIIRLSPTAETFVSDHPSVMNVKGMYVVENEWGNGVGASLVNTVQQWLMQHKYRLCGVDFESINPLGSRFWMKYFTPYTYSLVRKIDE